MNDRNVLEVIKSKANNLSPRLGIILGSGLGSFIEEIDDKVVYPFAELPGFPITSVEGHTSNLILGQINGVEIACMTFNGSNWKSWKFCKRIDYLIIYFFNKRA